jgi:hypothetical protein
MEQALKDERLALMIEHASLDQKCEALQAQKLPLHQRITEIDYIELRESMNLDGNDTQLVPGGAVSLGQ